jgi:hypothetical protein
MWFTTLSRTNILVKTAPTNWARVMMLAQSLRSMGHVNMLLGREPHADCSTWRLPFKINKLSHSESRSRIISVVDAGIFVVQLKLKPFVCRKDLRFLEDDIWLVESCMILKLLPIRQQLDLI